jgi:hypothetical protein
VGMEMAAAEAKAVEEMAVSSIRRLAEFAFF